MPHTGVARSKSKAESLSQPQRAALAAIRDHIREKKLSPTYEEIAARLGVSKGAARQAIALLARKQMIERSEGRYRNLVVTRRGHRAVSRSQEVA